MQLIVTEFVTVDGVMEAPGGEPTHPNAGWVGDYFNDEIGAFKEAEQLAADAMLLGRVTYEGFAGAWPQRTGAFADKLNTMPKYVVSSTLTDPEWHNTTVLTGPMQEEVLTLKGRSTGNLLVAGSATLVHGLLQAGLVDELRLMIFPVAIGPGLRVFPDGEAKLPFSLTDTKSFPGGVVVNTYGPVAQ